MVAVVRFSGTLTTNETGGHWVVFPYDGREVFGAARAPVAGTVNGTPFRTRLAVYGGVTYVGLNREIRAAAGAEAGDVLDIELDRDDGPRQVEVPAELAAALAAAPAAGTAYEALSFSHRREYASWVAAAKKEETRRRRAARAVEMLTEGVQHP
jgi:bifunctional DNA-binding transcriptional regulator/antitoxin component of YhaV-PrlF toxin-antitoxin module